MNTLGIGNVMRSAFVALWIGWLPIIACILSWIAAETALTVVAETHELGRTVLIRLLTWGAFDFLQVGSQFFAALRKTVDTLPHHVVRALFMGVLLRTVLTGPRSVVRLSFAGTAASLFGVNLVWVFLFFLTEWLARSVEFPTSGSGTEELVFFVAVLSIALGYAWLLSRFSMIYPLSATGAGWRPIAAWRLAKGHSIRLFALVILLLVPLGVARGIVESLPFRSVLSAPFGDAQLVERAFGNAVFNCLSLAVLMVVFAVVYTRLSGFPAVGIPGAERTPGQLADTFD